MWFAPKMKLGGYSRKFAIARVQGPGFCTGPWCSVSCGLLSYVFHQLIHDGNFTRIANYFYNNVKRMHMHRAWVALCGLVFLSSMCKRSHGGFCSTSLLSSTIDIATKLLHHSCVEQMHEIKVHVHKKEAC